MAFDVSREMKKPLKISLVVLPVIGCVAVLVFFFAIHRGQERHARACIETITELADRAIITSIPQGSYMDAVDTAEYIQGYYPVGAVLPREHRFAEQYQIERTAQIERILVALRAETGSDFGTDWHAWKNSLANKSAHPTRYRPPAKIPNGCNS